MSVSHETILNHVLKFFLPFVTYCEVSFALFIYLHKRFQHVGRENRLSFVLPSKQITDTIVFKLSATFSCIMSIFCYLLCFASPVQLKRVVCLFDLKVVVETDLADNFPKPLKCWVCGGLCNPILLKSRK